MIDFKKTLINLHEKFPEYDLDKLIEIIDAIVETVDFNKINYPTGTRNWWDGPYTIGDDPSVPWTTISYSNKSESTDNSLEKVTKWNELIKSGIAISGPCKQNIIK